MTAQTGMPLPVQVLVQGQVQVLVQGPVQGSAQVMERLHVQAMELFQVPFQEPLDQWSAGEIDETVLRRDTEYDQRWGFDFSMYRPILEYARNRGIEVVALNAPKELAFAVAKDGIDALAPELASDLPELDLENADHRELFDAEFDVA